MNACQYLFINKGAQMSPGKIAAQAGHAAVEGYKLTSSPALIDAWYEGGGYKKIVLEARNELHIFSIHHYLTRRGIQHEVIIDEGHTEVEPHTATAIGTAIVDKDDPHVAAAFSSFKLYRDRPPTERQHDQHTFWWERSIWTRKTAAPKNNERPSGPPR